MACCTRSAVAGEMRPLPLSTMETVVTETPASWATSVILAFLDGSGLSDIGERMGR